MSYHPPIRFNAPWTSVPQVWFDTETTGVNPGKDHVVEVACVRFDGGEVVDQCASLINPGMSIPAEATAIHGINDNHVRDAPSLGEFLSDVRLTRLLSDAQPGAYNSQFDRLFVQRDLPFDMHWPWLDTLPLVRFVDRFERGKGRHKLENSCRRHGVLLHESHRALVDARAAGELFNVLVTKMRGVFGDNPAIGDLLRWIRIAETEEWARFHEWLSRQPEQVVL